MKKRNKKRGGFTLVEMMVAIAVFSLIMVAAMSALINVIDANNKARSVKTAVNNINFALESMSRDMRSGTDYACGNNAEPNGNCPGGGNIIKYKSPRADLGRYVYYKFENNQIKECLEKDGQICDYDIGPFLPITSSEVKITKTVFYVLNTGETTKQPRAIITISGEAGTKEKTVFDLQTGISQRVRPE
jgi:prepilin-type N-terminal cleavage/methylation domain-containing protein